MKVPVEGAPVQLEALDVLEGVFVDDVYEGAHYGRGGEGDTGKQGLQPSWDSTIY